MIYIITEDSGSGFTFWENMQILLEQEGLTVLSSEGIGNMKRTPS